MKPIKPIGLAVLDSSFGVDSGVACTLGADDGAGVDSAIDGAGCASACVSVCISVCISRWNPSFPPVMSLRGLS